MLKQIGTVSAGGINVGVVMFSSDEGDSSVAPNTDGYEPTGRAEDGLRGEHPAGQDRATHGGERPAGRVYDGGPGDKTYTRGSAETDAAIEDAARTSNQDPNFMRGVASIESGMNPSSNANRSTQYKGLYQIGSRGNQSEWARFGEGNIYSARDNAMATSRIWNENAKQFKKNFGRNPTETEHYLMHQQGLGFYTRGAMTNIGGNPYPGMHGPQTHDSFEAGWGRELARRKAAFSKLHPPAASVSSMPDDL